MAHREKHSLDSVLSKEKSSSDSCSILMTDSIVSLGRRPSKSIKFAVDCISRTTDSSAIIKLVFA